MDEPVKLSPLGEARQAFDVYVKEQVKLGNIKEACADMLEDLAAAREFAMRNISREKPLG